MKLTVIEPRVAGRIGKKLANVIQISKWTVMICKELVSDLSINEKSCALIAIENGNVYLSICKEGFKIRKIKSGGYEFSSNFLQKYAISNGSYKLTGTTVEQDGKTFHLLKKV